MTSEIIIAGFGGQGVLSMGKILAYAGAMSNKEVTWLPSYGPEQRGGTSNVTVVISDGRISSPVIGSCDIAIVLNQQSLDKFERIIKPGGKLLYETYGILHHPTRTDIDIFPIAAMQMATDNNMPKMFNTIVLGALLSIEPIVGVADVMKGLKKTLPSRYHHLLPDNEKAIMMGQQLIKPTLL